MRISDIAMSALVASMTLSAAATSAVAAMPSNATGYMVYVHTCTEDHAGTNAKIDMRLDIRDINWNLRRLGPWTQNICDVDDHEYGDENWYFFSEPKENHAFHIENLILTSDGRGGNSGWCWDTHEITYIEEGKSIWTWAWEFKSPWIYEGIYAFPGRHFDEDLGSYREYPGFTYGIIGRPIPSDLHQVNADDIAAANSSDDKCPPQSIFIACSLSKVIPREGNLYYTGTCGHAGTQGTVIRIRNPNNFYTYRFLRAGRTTAECNEPQAFIDVGPRHALEATDLHQVFGTSSPPLPFNGYMYMCAPPGVTASTLPSALLLDIEYQP